MTSVDSPTPEGRRCPECGGAQFSAKGHCITVGCPSIGRRANAAFARMAENPHPLSVLSGRYDSPTPAPEGGVPEDEDRDDSHPPCPKCGVESLYVLAPEERRGQYVCDNPKCEGGYFTPTSAEGGEARHHLLCRWQQTTPAECEYRETHHYCPHPEHACNCAEAKARQLALVDRVEPEPVAVSAGASPTPAATGEEAQMRVLDGLAVLQDKLGDEGQESRAKAVNNAEALILSLRRQLAEAQGFVQREYDRRREAEARATTAERRLEEKEAHVKLADQRGRAEWELRVKAEGEASAFKAEATALQQEVARLRKLASRVAGHIVHTSACPYHLRGECYCGLDELRRDLAAARNDLAKVYAALPDGPTCRDCADSAVAGRCDATGRPCHPAEDAARYISEARAAEATVERLRGELEAAGERANRWHEKWEIQGGAAERHFNARLAAEARLRALGSAAKDCADELESEVRHRYGHPDIHPAMQGRYERDMESVEAVRSLLTPTPSPTEGGRE